MPKAIEVFSAAGNGRCDGTGCEYRGDHGTLDTEGFGKEDDGSVRGDVEYGREHIIVHFKADETKERD